MTWISVKEKTPEKDKPILIYCEGVMYVAWSDKSSTEERWEYSSCCGCAVWVDDITHWQPLPEAPK